MKSPESNNHKKMLKLLNHPKVQAWRAVMSTFEGVIELLEKQLSEQGIHISRFLIMFHLYFEGSLSAVELARKLRVTRGNISTFIKRLEADDQIEICASSPSESRPKYCLTDSASADFEHIFTNHAELVKKLIPGLSKDLKAKLEKI